MQHTVCYRTNAFAVSLLLGLSLVRAQETIRETISISPLLHPP